MTMERRNAGSPYRRVKKNSANDAKFVLCAASEQKSKKKKHICNDRRLFWRPSRMLPIRAHTWPSWWIWKIKSEATKKRKNNNADGKSFHEHTKGWAAVASSLTITASKVTQKKKVSSFFCFFSFFHLRLGQTTTTTAPAEASNRAHASFYHPLHQNFEKKRTITW